MIPVPRQFYRLASFGLVPFFILLLVRNDLNQVGSVDPYFYTALSIDYVDMVSRYSGYYYSTRLSHILPNALATFALDEYAGYILVRYLQLIAATIATYAIARHYTDEAVAWLVTIFFCSHVWLLRSLLWDYVDGSVVVYSLVGIALLLPRTNELWYHIGAGIAFSWAANGNPVGLIIPAAYTVTWLVERTDRPPLSKLKSIFACLMGITVGYSILMIAMLIIDPRSGWTFEQVTFATIFSLLSGVASNWFVGIRDIFLIHGFYQPLALPFFTAASVVAILYAEGAEGRRKAFGAFAFIAITTGIFLAFHFVFKAGLLRYSFSLIYALPASIVSAAALIGQWRPASPRPVILAGGIFLAVQFALWSNADALPSELSSHHAEIAVPLFILAFGGLAVLATMARAMRRPMGFVSILLIVLFASNSFFLRVDTARIYGEPSWRQTEWDVRNGAIYLQRFIMKRVAPKDPIRFWYGTRDPYLNSIQSTHLWLSSRASWPADAQMPVIDSAVRERIKQEARYVAILGTEAEIEAARAALEKAGLKTDSVARGSFKGRDWPGYDVLLLALQRG